VGRNKYLRKLIAGQLRVIARHQEKIKEELGRPAPDRGALKEWQHEIDNAGNLVRKYQKRLEK
jgi:hypothetical protein